MSSPGRTSSSSGFTLIEILAVLLLLAAAVSLAGPRVAGMMGELARRRDVGDLVFFLRRARVESLERGATVRVVRDGETLVASADGAGDPVATLPVPAGLALPEGALAQGIEFYPLGNASGWEATVMSGTDSYRVTVDPLTGEVDAVPAPEGGAG